MSSLITPAAIAAANDLQAEQPDTLTACLDAVARMAKKHQDAQDVAAIASAIVAACLPTTTYAADDDRARCINYAARIATDRAAADVARTKPDTISLDALADAEVTVDQEDPRLARPAAPRPDAVTVIDQEEVYAGALARITDDETLGAVATLPGMDYTARLAWTVRLSDLPHAGTYGDALATYHALTTDAETGRPLRRKGRPLTLRGALAVATGRKANDRSLSADADRLDQAQEAAAEALASARRDPWHITPEPQRRPWTPTAAALAAAHSMDHRTPYAPQTDVPTYGPMPHASQVVTIDQHGHAHADGKHLGHIGHPRTWEAIAEAHTTPVERTARTKTEAPPIGVAHDPACTHPPIGCTILYTYAETPDQTKARAAAYGNAPKQQGPVKKPAARKKSTSSGATGPTVTAGKPADDDAAADAARARAYQVN